MIDAQVVNPGSKHNAFEKVMPSLYGSEAFSYSQILDAVNFIVTWTFGGSRHSCKFVKR